MQNKILNLNPDGHLYAHHGLLNAVVCCRSVIYVDGIGNGGLYSEPNTIIKATHVHADADPSTCHSHWLFFDYAQKMQPGCK